MTTEIPEVRNVQAIGGSLNGQMINIKHMDLFQPHPVITESGELYKAKWGPGGMVILVHDEGAQWP